MSDFTPGFVFDEPAHLYHRRALDVATNSGLKVLRTKTPAHYKAWVEGLSGDEPETPALRVGRIVHAAILEPDRFAKDFVVAPDFGDLRSSTNRKARDEWLAGLGPGVTMVKPEELMLAQAMRESVLAHPTARLVIEGGRPEVSMRWIDERTGIKCKARADWWNEQLEFAMDLKTTTDASPSGFGRAVAQHGYNVQHAHYADGFRTLGRPIRNYLIVAVEKEPPYAVAVYHIDAAAEERGFQLLHRSMDALAECLSSGRWPAYSDTIQPLTIPGWAFSD